MSIHEALARVEAATRDLSLQFADEERRRGEPIIPELPRTDAERALAAAKRVARARRRRDTELAEIADLFRDPAWDLLLDLFISGEDVSITSVCMGATVPGSTGLRHLAALQQRGFVNVRPDPVDRRRRNIRLENGIRERLIRYFSGPEFQPRPLS
jgi:hypothetical protein